MTPRSDSWTPPLIRWALGTLPEWLDETDRRALDACRLSWGMASLDRAEGAADRVRAIWMLTRIAWRANLDDFRLVCQAFGEAGGKRPHDAAMAVADRLLVRPEAFLARLDTLQTILALASQDLAHYERLVFELGCYGEDESDPDGERDLGMESADGRPQTAQA